jgi:hypothetical protein
MSPSKIGVEMLKRARKGKLKLDVANKRVMKPSISKRAMHAYFIVVKRILKHASRSLRGKFYRP